MVGVAPPGAGKSRMMIRLATEAVAGGGCAIIYLHRQMLLSQMVDQLRERGIDFGVAAAGWEPDFDKPLQIAMSDTVFSRAVRKGNWDLTRNSLVIFDEAHQQTSKKALSLVYGTISDTTISDGHFDHEDCMIVGFSATPVDCGVMYEEMIDFGTYKELRECGSHLPVRVYSPSEIDTAGLKANKENEFSEKALEPRAAKIVGSAYDGWRQLNPDAMPAILFGPSVECARWFCYQWMAKGVRAAHIDSSICLIPTITNGRWTLEQVPSSKEARAEVLRRSKTGEIALITNRFVLREAIDMPWLFHGIGATVFGSESNYVQSVGRIQRYCDRYAFKIWQDHGGGYWRHGSPNAERNWSLGDGNKSRAKQRLERAQTASSPSDVEGIQCPRCNGWRTHGSVCPFCNHQHKASVRQVMQLSGELKRMTGSVSKKKKKQTDEQKIWTRVLYSTAARRMPVDSAVAQFYLKCRDSGIVAPKLSSVQPAVPEKGSTDYYKDVGRVWPWLRKK